MCEALMETVERRAAGRPVRRVRVRVGALHRVVPSAMDQAFSLVSTGTVAEGADVDLVTVPVRVTCRACGGEASSDDPLATCSACGAAEVDLEGGDEFLLESLELVSRPDSADAEAGSGPVTADAHAPEASEEAHHP